jgi:mRNA interferase RelE/StbE
MILSRGGKIAKFNVKLSNKSEKFLDKTDSDLCSRIAKKLLSLQDDPIPHDAKKMQQVKDRLYRLRVGDYRILYLLNYAEQEIIIVNIEHRKSIYDSI